MRGKECEECYIFQLPQHGIKKIGEKFLVPNIRVPEGCGRQGIWQHPCSKCSNEFIKTDLGKRFLIEGSDCNIKTQLEESSSNWSLKNKSREFRFSKRKLHRTRMVNKTINSLFFPVITRINYLPMNSYLPIQLIPLVYTLSIYTLSISLYHCSMNTKYSCIIDYIVPIWNVLSYTFKS